MPRTRDGTNERANRRKRIGARVEIARERARRARQRAGFRLGHAHADLPHALAYHVFVVHFVFHHVFVRRKRHREHSRALPVQGVEPLFLQERVSQLGEARDQHDAQVVQRGARHASALHGAPHAVRRDQHRDASQRLRCDKGRPFVDAARFFDLVLRPLGATGAAADFCLVVLRRFVVRRRDALFDHHDDAGSSVV